MRHVSLAAAVAVLATLKALAAARAHEAAGSAPKVTADEMNAVVEWEEKTLARALAAKRQADEKLADMDLQVAILKQKMGEIEHQSGVEKDVEVELEAKA